MTGGVAVVLGKTGRNFAAGMSGGIAFVLDEEGVFSSLCNKSMVELEAVVNAKDIEVLKRLVQNHYSLTESTPARRVLENWETMLPKFVKVMPIDYRRVLEQMEREKAETTRIEQELAAAQA
jgi:glutamate synthase domain-containing protein 3